MHSGETATVLDSLEIADAIRAFTHADWIRLRKTAAYYARINVINEDELLQEAFARCLTTRNCPIGVSVVKFVAEAIRSVADGTSHLAEQRIVLASVPRQGDQEAAEAVCDEAPSAESYLIGQENAAAFQMAILSLFEDDPLAKDIVEGTMAEMDASELRELTGLDKTSYDSKRKLIRRRIDKAYPQGWNS